MNIVVPKTSTTIGLRVRDAEGAIPTTTPSITEVKLEGPDGVVELANDPGAWDATLGAFPLNISKTDIADTLLYRALRLTWRFDLSGSGRSEYVLLEVREDDTPMYGSVDEVIRVAALRDNDFGCTTRVDLGRLVASWLRSASSFIEADRGKSFHPDVPEGIDSIANRIAMNTAAVAKQRAKAGIVKVGEYSVKLIEDAVITKSIRDDLETFTKPRRSAPFGISLVTGDVADTLEDAGLI